MADLRSAGDWLRGRLGAARRLPFDLGRLWRSPGDEADAGRAAEDGRTLAQRLEPWLVGLQELALWTDPKRSVLALAAFHVAHQHLLAALLGSTVLSAAATIVMAGGTDFFIYVFLLPTI